MGRSPAYGVKGLIKTVNCLENFVPNSGFLLWTDKQPRGKHVAYIGSVHKAAGQQYINMYTNVFDTLVMAWRPGPLDQRFTVVSQDPRLHYGNWLVHRLSRLPPVMTALDIEILCQDICQQRK